jgi:hypothetical protein
MSVRAIVWPNMKTQHYRFPYLPPLIVGIAVILFSTAAIATIMAWLPASTDVSGDILVSDDRPVASAKPLALTAQAAPEQVEGEARTKGRCAECGVIVSTREIDARDAGAGPHASGDQDGIRVASSRRYEVTIRLADRSHRVINLASQASLRPGERVVVIDGANPSNR